MPSTSTSNDASGDEVILEQHEAVEGSRGSESQLVITAIKQLSSLAERQLLNIRDFKLSLNTINYLRQLTGNLSHLTIIEQPTGELKLPQQPVGTEQVSESPSCMNSPQPIPGLPTASELPKKIPSLAEPIPLEKRVKRTEEPEPTPQAHKSDAEQFAELEDELFGHNAPTEARASELSEQMFGHLSQVPPAAVIFKMRDAYLDKTSLHRRMVDKDSTTKWCSIPYIM
ncbi:hypothetical protein G6514_004729 [Epicoccum nigrum]|nr:hypothetical protein G6514_004729 [Epicoccum nigrum]